VMKHGGRMMIHEASGGAHGNAHELATQAALLESISDEIAAIYAGRTGIEQNEVREMMKDETWLSADKAVELGFADSKFDTKQKTKSMNILDRLTKPSEDEAVAKIEALENAAQGHENQVLEFQDRIDTAEAALQEAATSIEAHRNAKIVAEEANLTLENKVEELEAQVASLTEESAVAAEASAEVIENLEEESEISKAKIDAKASEILAESGHPEPVAIDEEEAKSSEDIKAEFAKMPAGKERSAFFQAHKDVLSIHA